MFKEKMNIKKSCFCYSLEHGGAIIGILSLVWSAVSILMQGGVVAEWQDIGQAFVNQVLKRFIKIYLITRMALNFVYIIASIFLLKGIKKERANFFLPWLVWTVVLILADFTFVIFYLIVTKVHVVFKIQVSIFTLILASLRIYFIVCIVALRKLIKHRTLGSMFYLSHENCDSIEMNSLILESRREKVFPNSIWEHEKRHL